MSQGLWWVGLRRWILAELSALSNWKLEQQMDLLLVIDIVKTK